MKLEGNLFLKFNLQNAPTKEEGNLKVAIGPLYVSGAANTQGLKSFEIGLTTDPKPNAQVKGNAKIEV